ncbi:hypothetical protein ACMD2_16371 [Ananas comosus]|uniref:Uncharacterized protein n=1 Tax=Ananas comosus TaxID=4615 RepID=A0A199UFW8_ANACO|nr:hypothetical protein ACMD2_16371 [Ananas comosus]
MSRPASLLAVAILRLPVEDILCHFFAISTSFFGLIILCEEVKCGKAGDLEEEGLSSGETIESHAVLERLASKQSASHSAKEPARTKRRSAAWRSTRACRGGYAHSGRSAAWQSARACRGGHAHPANSSHSRLAGALAQRGKTLGAGAGTDADIGSKKPVGTANGVLDNNLAYYVRSPQARKRTALALTVNVE